VSPQLEWRKVAEYRLAQLTLWRFLTELRRLKSFVAGRKSRLKVLDRVMKMGAGPFAVWAIKHIVAPVHRFVYHATGGRAFRWGKRSQSILLLTTTGRRTGKLRTTPVFFLRDCGRFVVCNVKPGSERANPWVLNLRSHPTASVQVGPDIITCTARQVEGAELDSY
jgi:deazaflavin-dependent oxidoreductase (nitroreductase family)